MLNETTDTRNAAFERLLERADFTSDAGFRASYLTQHLRAFLADQIRALRGERSQREFGEVLDKPQSVVSRLEDEEYGKVTLQTLIDVATKLDIGLLARFVDFPTFLKETNDFSEQASTPAPYNREAVNQMLLAAKRAKRAAVNNGMASAVTAFAEFVAGGANQEHTSLGAQAAVSRQDITGAGQEEIQPAAANNVIRLSDHQNSPLVAAA